MTEIYEFAARLALSEAGDALMQVNVRIANLKGRKLAQDNPRKTSIRHYAFEGENFSFPGPEAAPIDREVLIARPKDLAAEALVELFNRFGFSTTRELVRAWQEDLSRV
jgi:hypothetical protein